MQSCWRKRRKLTPSTGAPVKKCGKMCIRDSIATGDYDAIIMGHSQFERIPISRERQERLLYEQILSLIHIL